MFVVHNERISRDPKIWQLDGKRRWSCHEHTRLACVLTDIDHCSNNGRAWWLMLAVPHQFQSQGDHTG